jgi:hypothetical protein
LCSTKYSWGRPIQWHKKSLEQVIAMSAPVFGRHSAYRNDIHVVSRFFDCTLCREQEMFAPASDIRHASNTVTRRFCSQVSRVHALRQRFCDKPLWYVLFVGWFDWPVPSTDAFQQGRFG